MKDLYDSVFAHLSSKIGDRINEINEEKDAAMEALEKEKEAAEEAYQAEIDAIQKAVKAREQELDLQQKQYNLSRLMNQKTILLYSEGKGMHYVTDTSGIREAKEEVDSAKAEIRIAEIEELIEKSNNYYDSLIKKTKDYYESMVGLLEGQKKQFESLQDLLNEAQMSALLKELGLNEEALLSGSSEEFNKLRDAYLGILADLSSGNQNVLSALSQLSGMGTLPSYLGETAGAVSDLAYQAGSLRENLSGIDSSNVNETLANTAGASSSASEKVQGVTNALHQLSDEVSNYTLPPLHAENFLSSFSEDGEILMGLKGFVARFQALCSTIPDLWNLALIEAFGEGGGSGDPLAGGLPNDTKYEALFVPLLSALENCKTQMEEKLGECTNAWVTFQTDLSGIIGTNGDTKSVLEGEAPDTESIVGAVEEGGALIEDALNGKDGWTTSFEMAQEAIHGYASGIVDCIESMVKQVIDACREAIEAINLTEQASGGTGDHKLPKAYKGKGHTDEKNTRGKSYLAGSAGVKEKEENVLLSEYSQQEMTVYPDGRYRITERPTMTDLPKGAVVYNEKQTKEILENKEEVYDGYRKASSIPNAKTVVGGKEMTYAEFEELSKRFGESIGIYNPPVLQRQMQMETWAKQISEKSVVHNKNINPVAIQIGDIYLNDVQDVNGLANAIKTHFSNAMLQALHTR